MRKLVKRVEQLENQNVEPLEYDFSSMSNEELNELKTRLTRESLREKLHREPTEEEVVADIELDSEYFKSLSAHELEAIISGSHMELRRLKWRR